MGKGNNNINCKYDSVILSDLELWVSDVKEKLTADVIISGNGEAAVSNKAPAVNDEIIFTAPDGERFTQKEANALSLKENIIILCGHYKGVDQRVRDHFITKEYTIGDFVLTGGEIPAALMTDAIVRLLPGAMGDETSALSDSFQDGLLEPGVYTRPAEYKGWKVPEILLSGHQAKIEEWLYEESVRHTQERRPDLLEE